MLVSVLIFFVVLSLLILVHEFGHFITAIKAGIPVLEFGFGLPPRIFGKKIGNTIYSLNAIPFGGFVRLFGENGDEEEGVRMAQSKAFVNKSKKIRVMVILAGVIMNFLLGIASFAVVYSFTGILRETGKVIVVGVNPDSPALVAGVLVGDRIISIDGKAVKKSDEVTSSVISQSGKHTLVLETGPESQRIERKVSVATKLDEETGRWYMGVVLTSQETYYPPIWQRPFYGIYYGFKEALFWGKTIAGGLFGIIAELFKGQTPKDISGPVGIFAITTEAAKSGILTLVNFVGILSINLAVLNVMPFPALDGGRILFIGIEAVFGRKILPKIEAAIHTVGFVILILLLLLITVGDIKRVVINGGIQGFINSMGK